MSLKWAPGDRLNIKVASYQYRDPHVKDKTVSATVLSLIWESPYLGKTVFMLRRGPGLVCADLVYLLIWCESSQVPGRSRGQRRRSSVRQSGSNEKIRGWVVRGTPVTRRTAHDLFTHLREKDTNEVISVSYLLKCRAPWSPRRFAVGDVWDFLAWAKWN